MSVSIFHLHLRSLIELKQSGTVVEYTAAFWERLHPVLDLNSNLKIKSFVNQYIEGLREDIQEAVRSRSPSSITCASSLARIREDEIVKDAAKGADKLGVSAAPVVCRADHGGLTTTGTVTDFSPEPAAPVTCGADHGGLTPTGTVTDVSPEPASLVVCGVDHGVVAMDASNQADALTLTCLVECPSSDATVDVVPKLATSTESVVGFDSVDALIPATCSTGGLAHGHDGDNLTAASLIL